VGACGAAVGILVTMPGALPKERSGSGFFALHEDVWVTQASCAVGIAEALRIGLIDLHRQCAVSAGKSEKMEALYDYLTSPQCAQKLKAVCTRHLAMDCSWWVSPGRSSRRGTHPVFRIEQ